MSMAAAEQQMEKDPRVRRTREMLHASLEALMQEKSYDRISISEIAERATLNRATFYDHYPDKDSLLECMVASRFQALVAQRGLSFRNCDNALNAIALGVCDYLAEAAPALRESEKPLETAVVAVIRGMMLEGLGRHSLPAGLTAELVASSLAWAIYGAAWEWVRTPQRVPACEAAAAVHRLLLPVLAGLP